MTHLVSSNVISEGHDFFFILMEIIRNNGVRFKLSVRYILLVQIDKRGAINRLAVISQ